MCVVNCSDGIIIFMKMVCYVGIYLVDFDKCDFFGYKKLL